MILQSPSESRKIRSIFHYAATFCLVAPLIGCAVLMFSPIYFSAHPPQTHLAAIVHGAIQLGALTLGFLGLVFGLVALGGIRRFGAKGILAKVLIGFFVFVLLIIPASDTWHRSLVEIAWQPPVLLAQKIATTDRVIVLRKREDSITKTGDDAKKIISAVSASHRDAGNYKCGFETQIEFIGQPTCWLPFAGRAIFS